MDIIINLGTFNIVVFIAALLTAIIATLDILKFTNVFRGKTSPEKVLICLIPLFTMPTMTALGNAISEFWGDVLPSAIFFFIFGSMIIAGRFRETKSHNKSLNTDASDAGAG